jgi:hypothetical protein
MLRAAGVVCVVLWATNVHAVNRCVIDGRVTYQDGPCPSGVGRALDLPASGAPSAGQQDATRGELQELKRRNAIAEGVRTGKPVITMTRKELDQAMGLPNTVNAGNYGGTLKDQLVYYRPGVTWYVYTTNGVVDSIQAGMAMQQPKAVSEQRLARCPSSLEVRNVEITADNLGISGEDRQAILRRVEGMRACKSM